MNPILNAGPFQCESRKEAFAKLEQFPFSCVLWTEGGKEMSAIYWNGKRRVQPAKKKINWLEVK